MSQPYNSLGIPVVSNLGGGGGGSVNISAGTTSNNLTNFVLSNGNGVSFGLNGSTITATVATNYQAPGAYLTTAALSDHSHGNPTLFLTNLSGTTNSNSAGFTLSLSAAAPGGGGLTNINVSAGTTSQNLSAITFSNQNGVSFGLNGSVITGSHNGITTAAQSDQVVNSINGSTGTFTFNTGSSLSSSRVGNAFTWGLASNITTALQSAGAYLTTARASNDAVGLNTAQTNVTWTVNSSGLSFNAGGYAGTTTAITGGALVTLNSAGFRLDGAGLAGTSTGFAGANISGSMTHNSAGLNLSLSVAAPGGGGAVNFSAGTTSQNLQSVIFANSNGVSFGLGTGASSQSITATVATNYQSQGAYLTTAALSNHSHGNPQLNLTNLSGTTASNSAGFTLSLSAGNYLTTARASNDAIGTNTAQTNVTWTVNSAGLSFNAAGYAGTGTSATNASITLNSNGLAISVAAPGGGAGVTLTGSDPFAYRELLGIAGGQGTLWMNPVDFPAAVQFNRVGLRITGSNATNSSGSATISAWVGFYTRNASTLSLLASTSFSTGITQSGTVGSYSLYGGIKVLPIPWTTTMSANNYWVGIISRTTTGGANMTFGNLGISQIASTMSGYFGSASNTTAGSVMGAGIYSATTSGLPSAISFTQIQGNSSAFHRRPTFLFLNDIF